MKRRSMKRTGSARERAPPTGDVRDARNLEGRSEPCDTGLRVDRTSLVLQAPKRDAQLGVADRQKLFESRRLREGVGRSGLETVHVGHLFLCAEISTCDRKRAHRGLFAATGLAIQVSVAICQVLS